MAKLQRKVTCRKCLGLCLLLGRAWARQRPQAQCPSSLPRAWRARPLLYRVVGMDVSAASSIPKGL